MEAFESRFAEIVLSIVSYSIHFDGYLSLIIYLNTHSSQIATLCGMFIIRFFKTEHKYIIIF